MDFEPRSKRSVSGLVTSSLSVGKQQGSREGVSGPAEVVLNWRHLLCCRRMFCRLCEVLYGAQLCDLCSVMRRSGCRPTGIRICA